jgi:asparagine synthase (glutamine-hydrolysing)
MCGIAGIVAPDGFDPQTLIAMTHLVRHRGPNAFGFAYAGPVKDASIEMVYNENRVPALQRPIIGLGNRRLSILDVSPLGNMPMATEDGSYCVTFNGEIYNFKEIRRDLEQIGHRFRTGTDTEVLLRAYQEWGELCLQRFNGMWSFALWDRSQQKLFCARDRFGVKPFYYTISGGCFFFGSEIKQVLQASSMARVANPRTVYNFLEYGLLDCSSDTFFSGVQQLPGGHFLTLGLSRPFAPKIQRYWELRADRELKIGREEAIEEFRSRFAQAVKLRLRSDVPVGVCLSGGLDSSSILCQAKQLAPETRFQTFSACFDEKGIDERDYIAAAVSAASAMGHATFPEGSSFWQNVNTIAYHHDEPLGNICTFAQWSVMEDARKHGIPVILGGQGGDETLCGYMKYHFFYLWHLLRRADLQFPRELMLWARNGTRSYGGLSFASRYLPGVLRRPFSLSARVCTEGFRRDFAWIRSGLGAAHNIAERQVIDLTHSSLPGLLRHEDRNSMAHSVESRLPFLDYELVEFAVNCPPSLKLHGGWSKWILRSSMKNTLPEKIRLRKTKLGFDTPEAPWMRLGLQNGHRQLWESPKLRMESILNGPNLAREVQKFLRADSTALPANSLFRAISLEVWAQVHAVS